MSAPTPKPADTTAPSGDKFDYESIYDAEYFSGKKSFFYKLTGYRDFQGYFDRLERWMSPFVTGQRVLDVGCAYGFMLRRYAAQGKEVYGSDVSEHALSNCQKLVPDAKLTRVVLGQQSLPWPDGYFDSIYSNDVVEHIVYPEQPAALAEIARVLKPGGHFIFTTPNYGLLRRTFYSIPDKMEHHVGLRHIDDWAAVCGQAGLNKADGWTYLHGLFPLRTRMTFLPEAMLATRKG